MEFKSPTVRASKEEGGGRISIPKSNTTSGLMVGVFLGGGGDLHNG